MKKSGYYSKMSGKPHSYEWGYLFYFFKKDNPEQQRCKKLEWPYQPL